LCQLILFKITQNILLDFEKKTYDQEWNEKAILDRWDWFFTEAEQLLKVDLSQVKNMHQTTLV
jgi:hypothetical protein